MSRRKRIEKPAAVEKPVKPLAENVERMEVEPPRLEIKPVEKKPVKYVPRRLGGWPK